MSQTIAHFREDAATRPETRTLNRRRLLRWALMGGGILVVVVGGLLYWLNGGRYVSTDDAYVQADEMTLSTDVSGVVAGIPVHEGQAVKQGQVLFRLDPLKFQIALRNAQANLAQTELNLDSLKADYQAALSTAATREAQVNDDQATYQRLAQLVRTGAAPRQQYDDARYKLDADREALTTAQMQAKSTLAKLGGKPDSPVDQMPAWQQAQAQVAEAQRQLDHATVRAPFAGTVTRVNKLQPGMYLAAGTPAFGFVSDQHMWVEAQPKETALTWARNGDHASVTIDAYPGRSWDGVVEDIAPATDQEFSLLPAQNSSGNWVKVVQRLPVRVRLDNRPGDPPLSAGMSASVSIDTGHTRSLADLF